MSKRIEIDVALNASGVAKGAKDAEKAIDNLNEAVTDAGKGGAKDVDQLERELKQAQVAADGLEREVRDANDALKETGKGADTLGDSTKKAAQGVTGLREQVTDVRQAGRGIVDLVKGDVSGAMSEFVGATNAISRTIPAVGFAIGGLGAAWGIFAGFQQEANRQTQEALTLAEQMYQKSIDGEMTLEEYATSASAVAESLKILSTQLSNEWRWPWAEGRSELERLNEAFKIVSGGAQSLDEVLSMTNDELRALERHLDDTVGGIESQWGAVDEGMLDATRTTRAFVREQIDARDSAEAFAQALGYVDYASYVEEAERAAAAASELQAATDAVSTAFDEARAEAGKGAITEGVFNLEQYLADAETAKAAAMQFAEDMQVVTASMSDAMLANFNDLPAEIQSALAAAYAAGDGETKAAIERSLTDVPSTGRDAGRRAGEALSDGVAEGAGEPEVEIDADLDGAEREVEAFTSQRRSATIGVHLNTAAAERQIAELRRSLSRPVTVPVVTAPVKWD